jgi:hypothetical protein
MGSLVGFARLVEILANGKLPLFFRLWVIRKTLKIKTLMVQNLYEGDLNAKINRPSKL